MSNENLRERIIKLAWENPGQLRDALLPLVREARSAPTFERKTVSIQTGGGPKDVRAVVSGVWAVHKSIGRGGWSVTHVPSGLAVSQRVGTKREGMDIIRAFAQTEPALMSLRDEAGVRRFSSTIIDIVKNPYQYIDAEPPKTRGRKPTLNFEKILRDAGLRNLGTRYGKHGDHWGVEGGSMEIRVGRRDVVLSAFNASVYGGKVKGSWGMVNSELQSKMTEPKLQEWVREVKRAPSMRELRAEARGR